MLCACLTEKQSCSCKSVDLCIVLRNCTPLYLESLFYRSRKDYLGYKQA